jgi:hypothetical protein
MRVEALANWIKERYAIRERRLAGMAKPWTEDPILRDFRFCNVYREHDKETIWIAENWRNPNTTDPDVWFAMTVARFVNWSPTLEAIGYPVPWDSKKFRYTLDYRSQFGEKVYTGAYIIPPGGGYKNKAEYLAKEVLTPLWEQRDYVRASLVSCHHLHHRLMEFKGTGNFLAGQIVCDTKFTRTLDTALDWWEFAVEGPGSKRGLNRVCARPVNQNWKKGEWWIKLMELKARISPIIEIEWKMPRLSAQDLQNCLCEFDKYERVRLGEGRPRSGYDGAK